MNNPILRQSLKPTSLLPLSISIPNSMKRTRARSPSSSAAAIHSLTSTPPPSSQPSTPQQQQKQQQTHQKPNAIRKSLNLQTSPLKWQPLNLTQTELSLPLTFPTGQTFRWRKTGPLQYTGVVNSYLVSLKHLEHNGGDLVYCFHNGDSDSDDGKVALLDFLNVGISLSEMWEGFSASDERFAELAPLLAGARVLRQDPLECLVQFLCSSNNNIGRITKMVDYVSSLGEYLGTVDGFEFFEFPSLDRLSLVSEEELKVAGFGYRAKYIVGTVKALQLKPGGGAKWLASLRELDLEEVLNALCTLPGVGPKVAACIALFSLDQHHAVPVDTHVWKIATRHLLPELAGVQLTSKLSIRVAEAFVTRYGKYAGWAQTLLFVAELPSQKALIAPQDSCVKVQTRTVLKKKKTG